MDVQRMFVNMSQRVLTAFVEPPMTLTIAMAFKKLFLVRMSLHAKP